MDEIWKPVVGYEGIYEVSDHGRVKSLKFNKEKIRSQSKDGSGYWQVGLSRDGKEIKYRVHRLVALSFLDNPSNYEQVNHKDGCRTNNMLTNLEWCDQSHNQKHAWEHGLRRYSDSDYRKKKSRDAVSNLTEEKVMKIRELYSNSQLTQKEIGNMFDVANNTVSQIVNGKAWSHVK